VPEDLEGKTSKVPAKTVGICPFSPLKGEQFIHCSRESVSSPGYRQQATGAGAPYQRIISLKGERQLSRV
jgi:hypothetical protein